MAIGHPVVAGDEDVAGNLVTALERERQDVTTVVRGGADS
jgi:hypothetical protein